MSIVPSREVSKSAQSLTDRYKCALSGHFPLVATTVRRNHFISDSTRYYIQLRKKIVADLRASATRVRNAMAKDPSLCSDECQIAPMIKQLRLLNTHIRTRMRCDKVASLQCIAATLAKSWHDNKPKAVYQEMRTLERKPKRMLAKIHAESGEVAKNPIEARLAFQKRKCKLVRGSIVSIDEVMSV